MGVISLKENRNTILKVLLCAAFILQTIGTLAAWNTPATGYEASIYWATPIIFWIALGFSFSVATAIILLNIFGDGVSRLLHYAGWGLLGTATFSLASLCIIRGYDSIGIGEDAGAHIGALSGVVQSGFFDTYYPSIYTGPGAFQILSGVSTMETVAIYPIFYLFVFLIGVFVLTREIFPEKGTAYIITLLAFYLPIGTAIYLAPYYPILFIGMQSTIRLFPIIFFASVVTLHRKHSGYLLLASIFAASMAFYHPMASLLLMMTYTAIILHYVLQKKLLQAHTDLSIKAIFVAFCTTISLFILWSWSMFGTGIVGGVLSVLTVFEDVGNREVGKLSSFASDAVNYGYSIDTILQIGIINIIIYGLFIFGMCLYLLKYRVNKNYSKIGILFLLAGILVAVTGVLIFIDIGFRFSRFLDEVYLLAIIFAGFFLYQIGATLQKWRKILDNRKVFVILLVISLVICGFSVVSFHPSPFTKEDSSQDTASTDRAMETLLPRINTDYNISGIYFSYPNRYRNIQESMTSSAYTTYWYDENGTVASAYGTGILDGASITLPPYHFGYDTVDETGMLYDISSYLLLFERDLAHYLLVIPELQEFRWNHTDFIHLDSSDSSVIKYYNNGEFKSYIISQV